MQLFIGGIFILVGFGVLASESFTFGSIVGVIGLMTFFFNWTPHMANAECLNSSWYDAQDSVYIYMQEKQNQHKVLMLVGVVLVVISSYF